MTAADTLPAWPDGPAKRDDVTVPPKPHRPRRLDNSLETVFCAIVGSNVIMGLGNPSTPNWLSQVLGIVLVAAIAIIVRTHIPEKGWTWPMWIIAVTILVVVT